MHVRPQAGQFALACPKQQGVSRCCFPHAILLPLQQAISSLRAVLRPDCLKDAVADKLSDISASSFDGKTGSFSHLGRTRALARRKKGEHGFPNVYLCVFGSLLARHSPMADHESEPVQVAFDDRFIEQGFLKLAIDSQIARSTIFDHMSLTSVEIRAWNVFEDPGYELVSGGGRTSRPEPLYGQGSEKSSGVADF